MILSGNRGQSETTIHGWPSFFFGIPFAAIGIAGLLMMAGVIPVSQEIIHGLQWILWIFAGFFLFAGLSFMWLGFWHPKWKKSAKTLTLFFIFLIFLAPFNWWAFVSGETSFVLYFVVGLFDLIIVGIFCQFVYHTLQFFKYGTSRLLFFTFPFHLGGELKLGLEGLPSSALIKELELNLRFIEERYEIRGTGNDRCQDVVCHQKYLDQRRLAGREIPPGPVLEFEWSLPENAGFVNRLSERPARFWELEVLAKTSGVDYDERSLLPVCERP